MKLTEMRQRARTELQKLRAQNVLLRGEVERLRCLLARKQERIEVLESSLGVPFGEPVAEMED